jgi:hypothetical protein
MRQVTDIWHACAEKSALLLEDQFYCMSWLITFNVSRVHILHACHFCDLCSITMFAMKINSLSSHLQCFSYSERMKKEIDMDLKPCM